MGHIGNEIIQSRVWVDPSIPTPSPILNYKLTFPITVFDAVRRDMTDEDSPTLTKMLDLIFSELKNKQGIFPGKPANNLMTYAGIPGAVGAIKISQDIPWNPEEQGHDKIPTEKAVGNLLLKLGIVNPDGTVPEGGGSAKVRWSDIIGRPNIYTGTGMNEDGFMTQKAVTEAIHVIDSELTEHEANVAVKFDNILKRIESHTSADNPHNITLSQLGGISQAALDFHTNEAINPHGISAITIGLDRVDNTSDLEKPISTATKTAIDAINELISHMTDDVGGLKFIVNIKYDQPTGMLTWTYNDGSTLTLTIPINGLVDEVVYESESKELVIHELGGTIKKIDISDLFIRYIGSTGNNITVEIDGDQTTGDQIIKANIVHNGVTVNEMASDAVSTRVLQDQSVTGGKIHDLTITTIKYADDSITTEKIAEMAITNSRLDNRSVDGRVIFSSTIADRILAVRTSNGDPVWSQVTSEMIAHSAILTHHLINGSVTSDKLGNKSVITARIDDLAVTTEKLANGAVTNDKVSTGSISGIKLVENPEFTGVPKITGRPDAESNTNELPDTRWVRDFISAVELGNSNLGDRTVDGRALFSSPIKDRVLVVLKANNDAVWGLINNGMMDVNAINTTNIMNLAITGDKIHDKSIESRHIINKTIKTDHLDSNAVTSEKLFKSDTANKVLAVLSDNGNPVYAQVNQSMMEYNSIGTLQIQDQSVTLSKIRSSGISQRVLTVGLKNTEPVWSQITNNMIQSHAVDGRALFTSSDQDMILAVTTPGVDPAWLKINGNMLQERIIQRHHISYGAIWTEHLQEKIIETRHIADWTIQSNNIAPRAITGIELFTSAIPNRILAVDSTPYSNPQWMQIRSDMLEDLSVTKEKIFRSTHPYRVLAATQAGVPPEYTMITHQFIVDRTITPNKLQPDFVLHGTPELTSHPLDGADNFQIPSTRWVRKTIANIMKDFNPEILFDTIDSSMIQNHSIDGTKLMTHPYGPRVLGITQANEDVEFILIEEDLIVNGAVTTNKIQRSVQLLGSPHLEIRPAPQSSDASGGGQLIPDCQWVLDRIAEYGGGDNPGGGGTGSFIVGPISSDRVQGIVNDSVNPEPGPGIDESGIGPISPDRIQGIVNGTIVPEESGTITGGGSAGGGTGGGGLLPNSVITEYIMNRAVTAEKLFSSEFSNRVLAVDLANSDPAYLKVSQAMLENSRIIDSRRLFTSESDNMLLGVKVAGDDPEYVKVNHTMLETNIIETAQLVDRCVTGEKLSNSCITEDKLVNRAIIRSNHLFDNSISTAKIVDKAVEREKLDDKIIDRSKLDDNLELPAYTSVPATTDYERPAVRNTILSHDAPSGGNNGDIWFRYI